MLVSMKAWRLAVSSVRVICLICRRLRVTMTVVTIRAIAATIVTAPGFMKMPSDAHADDEATAGEIQPGEDPAAQPRLARHRLERLLFGGVGLRPKLGQLLKIGIGHERRSMIDLQRGLGALAAQHHGVRRYTRDVGHFPIAEPFEAKHDRLALGDGQQLDRSTSLFSESLRSAISSGGGARGDEIDRQLDLARLPRPLGDVGDASFLGDRGGEGLDRRIAAEGGQRHPDREQYVLDELPAKRRIGLIGQGDAVDQPRAGRADLRKELLL